MYLQLNTENITVVTCGCIKNNSTIILVINSFYSNSLIFFLISPMIIHTIVARIDAKNGSKATKIILRAKESPLARHSKLTMLSEELEAVLV